MEVPNLRALVETSAGEAASTQWRAVADQIRPKMPKLAAILDDVGPEVFAFKMRKRIGVRKG